MYGVSKISSAENIMLVSYSDAPALFMSETLNSLANLGVVVDMICQTAPSGSSIRFSFTASNDHFDVALKAIGGEGKQASPMISGGYTKINLFGEEMVDSVGVAARALAALARENVDIALVTTSDLDISLLVRREDSDVAVQSLRQAFEI